MPANAIRGAATAALAEAAEHEAAAPTSTTARAVLGGSAGADTSEEQTLLHTPDHRALSAFQPGQQTLSFQQAAGPTVASVGGGEGVAASERATEGSAPKLAFHKRTSLYGRSHSHT